MSGGCPRCGLSCQDHTECDDNVRWNTYWASLTEDEQRAELAAMDAYVAETRGGL